MTTPILSVLGDIFRMRRRDEIADAEYWLANADWVEKNTHKYAILLFPEPNPSVVQYVNGRIAGRDFDGEPARELGEWFCACVRIGSENEANSDTLRWAREKLLNAGIGAERIAQALSRASRISNYDEFFSKAMEVKRRDAEIPVARRQRFQ